MKHFKILICCCLIALSCNNKIQNTKSLSQSNQEIEFELWKQARLADLTSSTGWLTITALIWLKKDELTIGTDDTYDVTIPYSASANFGKLIKKNEDWSFIPSVDSKITNRDKLVVEELIVHHDQSGKTTYLGFESLSWYLIKRGDNYGIRVKDSLNKARFDLESISTFKYNPEYVFDAEVRRGAAGDSILITNAQGVVTSNKIVGWLDFEHKGKAQTLTFINGGPNTWFTVYGDETNSGETYGAGRFLYINVPDGATKVILDFNRSENPPCYHTSFATCPLPPIENKLKLEIRAGETSEH